jgi:hypothetical protein
MKTSPNIVFIILYPIVIVTVYLGIGFVGLTAISILLKDVPGFLPNDLKQSMDQANGFFSTFFLVLQKAAFAVIIGYFISLYGVFKNVSEYLRRMSEPKEHE